MTSEIERLMEANEREKQRRHERYDRIKRDQRKLEARAEE